MKQTKTLWYKSFHSFSHFLKRIRRANNDKYRFDIYVDQNCRYLDSSFSAVSVLIILPVIYNSSSNSPVFLDYESSYSWLFRGKGSVETLLVKMTPQRNKLGRIMSKCGLCDDITALMNEPVIKTIKSQHISNLYWSFLLIM